MSTEVEHYKGFTVKPILPGFGAEVAGVPFDQVPLPQETIDAVRALSSSFLRLADLATTQLVELSNKYAVLIFRDTGLDDARHVKFSQQLGELEVCPKVGLFLPWGFSRADNVVAVRRTRPARPLLLSVRPRRFFRPTFSS